MTQPDPERITTPFERVESPAEQVWSFLDYLLVTRGELRRQMTLVWDYVIAQTAATTTALERMETRMTSMEDAAYTRLAELAGLIRAEFESLKGQLDTAIADKDAATAAGVESALGEDSAADATRLQSLIAEFEQVLPVAVPEVPVPAPGEPAELPTEPATVEEPAQPVEEAPAEPSEGEPA